MAVDRSGIDSGPIAQMGEALSSPIWIMSAAHGDARSGVRVRAVMSCASEPPMVTVAIPRGHEIDPLIRDSRCFALCKIDPGDRLMVRKFPVVEGVQYEAEEPMYEPHSEDPFESLRVSTLATGAPILDRAVAVIDCTVVRHYDLEADHALYVGLMQAVRMKG